MNIGWHRWNSSVCQSCELFLAVVVLYLVSEVAGCSCCVSLQPVTWKSLGITLAFGSVLTYVMLSAKKKKELSKLMPYSRSYVLIRNTCTLYCVLLPIDGRCRCQLNWN